MGWSLIYFPPLLQFLSHCGSCFHFYRVGYCHSNCIQLFNWKIQVNGTICENGQDFRKFQNQPFLNVLNSVGNYSGELPSSSSSPIITSLPLPLSLFHSSDPRVNWLQRYTCKWSNDKNLTFSLPGPNLIDSSSRFSRKRKNEKPNKKITVIIAKWEHFLIILIHFNYPAKEFIYLKKKKV